MLRSKLGLTVLLMLVFAANYVETRWEGRIDSEHPLAANGYEFARAMQHLEGAVGLGKFENHDATNVAAVWGYSISYFFLFPLLCLAIGLTLAWREDLAPYRVLASAVAIDYCISVLFFLFVPVPERWFVPDSGAILLSDLLEPRLIEWIRPFSGLDNSFPSTHTSLTVILILVCYQFRVRLRTTDLAFGISIILATFVLGIHWLPDIGGGVALGCLSVVLAQRLVGNAHSLSL
jgi:membrane-associated phospholipid phosphatase